jgi:hypothetical protein
VQLNDKPKLIEYYKAKYFEYGNEDKKQYYELMKSLIDIDKWPQFVEDLIKEYKQKSYYFDKVKIADVFIWEGYYDRLFEFVKANIPIEHAGKYEPYFPDDYRNEYADYLEQGIERYIKNNYGKTHNKTSCRYLRRLLKISSRQRVDTFIESLKMKFAKRPDLVAELAKV